jgi:low affinity Fe/Cu permease
MKVFFTNVSERITKLAGSPYALIAAIVLISIWLITGPIFNFSDTWQLFINTFTTIITFLMVFAIQHTQNRESKAIQIKLNELIRSVQEAHNAYIGVENDSEERLEEIEQEVLNQKG